METLKAGVRRALLAPLVLHCLIHAVLVSGLFIPLLPLKGPYVVCLSNSISWYTSKDDSSSGDYPENSSLSPSSGLSRNSIWGGEKMERLPSKQRLLCPFQTLCDFHCAEAIALM